MSGRAATINVIPGKYALSVGRADMPAPKSWQWVALGDIARLESGHTPSREHPEYWDGGIAWIGIKDARTHHGSIIAETFQTITQAGIDNSATRLLPAETVCLSRTASVGYVVVMGREMATSQDFVNWVCGPAIDPHFLKQLFIAENESLFRFGKGSTHTTIYYPEVKAFHVCLPPLNEQKRIVAKVEELTARSRRAKEALDAVPPMLDQLRQSILAAAFRGDLTADWRAKNPDVEPADTLLARIHVERRSRWEAAELTKLTARGKRPADDRWKERYEAVARPETTDLPPLPASWVWARVEELATKVVDGVHKKPNYMPSGIPFLTVKNLTAGPGISFEGVNYITPQDHEEYSKRTDPERGDILISKDGTLGVTRLVTSDRTFSIFVSLALVKPVLRGTGPFLELAFQSPIFQERFVRTGSGLQHIHLGDLRNAALPLAPLAEQVELLRRVQGALDRVAAFEAQVTKALQSLPEMDSAVLAKAFRGDLVAQDPNDEPASVLLERIRAARTKTELPSPRARQQVRRSDDATADTEDNGDETAVTPIRPSAMRPTSKTLSEIEHQTLLDEVSAALWTLGPLDKDEAVRHVADHLRQVGYVHFERLRADGPLFGEVLDAIERAVKVGRLDRPKRGHVRACKADAAGYTADDWRHALVSSLSTEPADRDDAIRAAAEWARDNLGLEFSRLRGDGHIVEGLRSAINSAIRRGDLIRHNAKRISRAASQTRSSIPAVESRLLENVR